jgi:hypothetical protein
MTVGRMVEALEALHFNKREEARLVVDPGVANFLVRRRSSRCKSSPPVVLDPTAMNDRRFPPPWSVEEQQACFPLWG